MIPTYINVSIIEIGLMMTEQRPPWVGPDEFFSGDQHKGFEFISNESLTTDKIYSITRDEIITVDDIEIDESTGELKEKLFIVTNVMDIQSGDSLRGGWTREMLSNSGYEDFEIDTMKALYEVSEKYISPTEIPEFIKTVAFIGMWRAHMSQGYFDEYPELEYIEFVGEGTIELVK